jgi:hypothetical protein
MQILERIDIVHYLLSGQAKAQSYLPPYFIIVIILRGGGMRGMKKTGLKAPEIPTRFC